MQDPLPSTKQGAVSFQVGSEIFKTTYWTCGEFGPNRRPLVLLHGGPGIPHSYLLSFRHLTLFYDIPVVFYDQLGCGESTHLPEKAKEFWNVNLYMNELENLLRHLEITDNFDLFGHSWGGMFASHYAATRRPGGLKKLILANSLARMSDWVDASLQLLANFPQAIQDAMNYGELHKRFDTDEYKHAVDVYMKKHICQLDPMPAYVAKSFEDNAKDPTVSDIMYGRAWCRCFGTLKDWDVIPLLPRISQRTLVYNGVDDEAQDSVIQPFLDHIPNVQWHKFRESSHLTNAEETHKCMKVVGEFLRE